MQRIFLTKRSDFVTYYKIRRAVEQDNDDVVKLIDQHSKTLKKLYGEYYIGELISEKRHSDRQVMVAEYDGVAVGVMILNKTLNYDIVNHAFKLETFYGLKKPHEADVTKLAEAECATNDQETYESKRSSSGDKDHFVIAHLIIH